MKIISIIDDFEIIDKILKHLNLWDIRNHDPPEIEPVHIPELTYIDDSNYDNSGSQIPVFAIIFSGRLIALWEHMDLCLQALDYCSG